MNQQYGNQYYNNNQQPFNQGGFQQGVTQQQLGRIHQNSLFNGQESNYNNAQVQRIQQQTMQHGTMANPQVNYYSQQQQGFGGQTFTNQGYNQGFQQGVSQQQLDRIHQASLYGGQSQPENAYVERIHQSTMQGGTMAQPQLNNYGSTTGYGTTMMGSNYGGQTYTNNTQQAYQQGVSQQQLDRIHQASLYGGQSQPENAYVERIHQSTMQGGTMAQPQLNNYGGTTGYGTTMMGSNYGGQTYTNNTQQAYQQGVSQQQLDRIHQASLYGGQSQPENAYVERIHQSTMQGGTMAQPQLNTTAYYNQQQRQGFGGGQSYTSGVNTGAFNQVMSADAGMRDAEGRTDVYAQSLYTGRNQYDTVNSNVLNQLTHGMTGRQF